MIEFNNKFRIEKLDKYNIIVKEKRVVVNPKTKSERETWVDHKKYFVSLKSALNYLEDYILESGIEPCKSLEDFIDKINEFKLGVIKEGKEYDIETEDIEF